MSVTLRAGGGLLEVIQVNALDTSYPDEEDQMFLDDVQLAIDRNPNKIIMMGDFNARVGGDNAENRQNEVGIYGYGQFNHRGQMLLKLCAIII